MLKIEFELHVPKMEHWLLPLSSIQEYQQHGARGLTIILGLKRQNGVIIVLRSHLRFDSYIIVI